MYPVDTLLHKKSEASSSPEEVKEGHLQNYRALTNPFRREILRALGDGDVTIDILQLKMKLDDEILKWHLSILERARLVEKKNKDEEVSYSLTQQGRKWTT